MIKSSAIYIAAFSIFSLISTSTFSQNNHLKRRLNKSRIKKICQNVDHYSKITMKDLPNRKNWNLNTFKALDCIRPMDEDINKNVFMYMLENRRTWTRKDYDRNQLIIKILSNSPNKSDELYKFYISHLNPSLSLAEIVDIESALIHFPVTLERLKWIIKQIKSTDSSESKELLARRIFINTYKNDNTRVRQELINEKIDIISKLFYSDNDTEVKVAVERMKQHKIIIEEKHQMKILDIFQNHPNSEVKEAARFTLINMAEKTDKLLIRIAENTNKEHNLEHRRDHMWFLCKNEEIITNIEVQKIIAKNYEKGISRTHCLRKFITRKNDFLIDIIFDQLFSGDMWTEYSAAQFLRQFKPTKVEQQRLMVKSYLKTRGEEISNANASLSHSFCEMKDILDLDIVTELIQGIKNNEQESSKHLSINDERIISCLD